MKNEKFSTEAFNGTSRRIIFEKRNEGLVIYFNKRNKIEIIVFGKNISLLGESEFEEIILNPYGVIVNLWNGACGIFLFETKEWLKDSKEKNIFGSKEELDERFNLYKEVMTQAFLNCSFFGDFYKS